VSGNSIPRVEDFGLTPQSVSVRQATGCLGATAPVADKARRIPAEDLLYDGFILGARQVGADRVERFREL
jgi:hypothetical protein